MKESDHEKIKLRANYFNGLAIVFAAAGAVVPAFTLMFAGEFHNYLASLLVVVFAAAFSWGMHGQAQDTLNKLDQD